MTAEQWDPAAVAAVPEGSQGPKRIAQFAQQHLAFRHHTLSSLYLSPNPLDCAHAFIKPELHIAKQGGLVPDILNMESSYDKNWNVAAYNPPSHEDLHGHPLLPSHMLDEEPLRFGSSNPPTQDSWDATANQDASHDALSAERVDSPDSVDAPINEHTLSHFPPPLTPRSVLESAGLIRTPLSRSPSPDSTCTSIIKAPQDHFHFQLQFRFSPASPSPGLDSPFSVSPWLIVPETETFLPHQRDDDFDDFFYKIHGDEYVVAGDIRELGPQYVSPAELSGVIGIPATANDAVNAQNGVDASETEAVSKPATANEVVDEYTGVDAPESEEVLGTATLDDLTDEHDHYALDSEEDKPDDEKTPSTCSSPGPIAPLPARCGSTTPITASPLVGPSVVVSRTDDESLAYEHEFPEEEASADEDNDADSDYVETHSRAPKRRRNDRSKPVPARNATRKGKKRASTSKTTFKSSSSSSSASCHSRPFSTDGSDYVGRRSPPSKRLRTNSGKAVSVQQSSRSASTTAKGKGKAKAPAPSKASYEYSSFEEDTDDGADAYDGAEDDGDYDDSTYGSTSSSSSKRRRSRVQPAQQPNHSASTTSPPAQLSVDLTEFIRTPDGRHHCTLCVHDVKSENGIKRHLSDTHTNKEPIPCPAGCNKTFKRGELVRRHLGEKGQPVRCKRPKHIVAKCLQDLLAGVVQRKN
ncbi:hypothetical protein R3P38DRAFT_3598029 [Favolaschia claudopus]|uniref:C2H2-type domain-containing protein n=1 Tax=Favolaschia claudopus TaxID=2862362 RepID=A0AAW0AEG0_9AGAR